MYWRSPKPIRCAGTLAAHSPLPTARPAPVMAVCSVVCGAACWAVCSSRTSFWPQYEIGKKFCGCTDILLTSTPTSKLLCLHWKTCCHIFHQFIACGLKVQVSSRHSYLGGFVAYSFSSKGVMDCDSFYIPADNNVSVTLEINIL